MTGVMLGTAFVTYTLATGCKTDTPVHVNPIPAGITGWGGTITVGTSSTYADPTPGGIWTSSNPSVARIDMSTGTVTGLTAGVVTISYTVGSGCSALRTLTVITLPATRTGKSITDNSDFMVTPNPTTGRILISGTLEDQASAGAENTEVLIEVTDMLGRNVYRATATAHYGQLSSELTLSNTLANGMYLLNLRTGSERKLFHVVVER
jgi:hypothetical protein